MYIYMCIDYLLSKDNVLYLLILIILIILALTNNTSIKFDPAIMHPAYLN